MASTTYGTNDAETVKLWSRRLFREALNQTTFKKFMGPDSNSMIQVIDDTSKGPGDRVTVTLRTQLSGDGISGDSTLEGQEESLTTHTQNLTIDQLRHAVRSSGRMTEQRVPFSLREEARFGLQDWWADRIDTALANQLGANNAQSDTRFTGSQAVTAADGNHHLWPDGNTADENLGDTVSDQMTLTLIDDAVETAKTATFPMRPLNVGGSDYFVCIMHPNQARDLRTNTATGQWLDIQKAAMQGGRIGENPIFTGALGVYNGVILHENIRVPRAVNSSTGVAVASTRRAIFAGAQAGMVAFGRENGPNTMTWVEESFDYGNQLGVSAGLVWGAVRSIQNSESFGSIVIATGSN